MLLRGPQACKFALLLGGEAGQGGSLSEARSPCPRRLQGLGAAAGQGIPLEFLAVGEFEPVYRTPLDVLGGERPVSWRLCPPLVPVGLESS